MNIGENAHGKRRVSADQQNSHNASGSLESQASSDIVESTQIPALS